MKMKAAYYSLISVVNYNADGVINVERYESRVSCPNKRKAIMDAKSLALEYDGARVEVAVMEVSEGSWRHVYGARRERGANRFRTIFAL